MAEYKKQQGVQGVWAKAADIVSGTRLRLTTECVPVESTYQGTPTTQNVAKARFEGDVEDKNVNINRPSINGLIDAFGPNSNDWIGKVLTAHTEKMVIAGKRVTAMYLVAEGYEVGEDKGGYLIVTRASRSVSPGSVADMSFDSVEDDDPLSPQNIPF